MLVFGTLLLGFTCTPAGLLCPAGSVTDILQFVFTLVFSQNTKPQCPADHYSFSMQLFRCTHLVTRLSAFCGKYVCIGEIFLEESLVGLRGVGGPAGEDSLLEAAAGNQERCPIPHKEELIPVLAQHTAKPSLVSIKQLIPTC